MRKSQLFPLLLFTLLTGACSSPTESGPRSLNGSWSSSGLPSVSIHMTISEVARSVDGAGSWVEPARAVAFRVAGARADEFVSLLLELEGEEDVNFRGRFTSEDSLDGTLIGGRFRDQPIGFSRTQGDD